MKIEFSMYDPNLVRPMRDEVVTLGFKELLNKEEAKKEIESEGTALVFVNSVCGCAAGKARPGLKMAINWAAENNCLPDRLLTVFAGMEKEVVGTVRGYLQNNPPSSPQIAMMKDGKLVSIIQRHEIENSDEFKVAEKIVKLLQDGRKE
ncbi:MAG: BrxA/BrxB family bacilliredoxin [Ignavibacteriota bacterium]|nr:BrxA/BrxB family bacilliredoxin [Ignavibacteriota bacterium]